MRRCFVVIATVLMVAAVGVSQPANGAEPPPRPSAPPTTQGADRGWGKPKALHKFRPVTAKRSAAPSRSTVQAPGARRLLADLEGSKITPAQFARYAMAKYDQIEGSVPARYRDKNLELPDIAVLATKVTQAMTKASPAQRRSLQRMKARHTQPAAGAASRRSATTSDPCEAFDPEGEAYNCVLSSGQLRVMWATDGGSAMPAEKLNTDNDSNDIPDMIDETLATLQGAWTTYDDMGFTNPTGTITLRYSNGALVPATRSRPTAAEMARS